MSNGSRKARGRSIGRGCHAAPWPLTPCALKLHALAYNLGKFLRTLATPVSTCQRRQYRESLHEPGFIRQMPWSSLVALQFGALFRRRQRSFISKEPIMKSLMFAIFGALAVFFSSVPESFAFQIPCEKSIDCPRGKHCNGRYCVPNHSHSIGKGDCSRRWAREGASCYDTCLDICFENGGRGCDSKCRGICGQHRQRL